MVELFQANRQWASRPNDERFTSIPAMLEHFGRLRNISADKTVSTKRIHLQPTQEDTINGMEIVGPNGAAYEPTNWSFGQLCSIAGIGAAEMRKLPAPIASDAINWCLKMKGADDCKVLLRRDDAADFREFSAITGPNYGRVWNYDVTKAIFDRFGDGVTGDFRVPGEFGKRVVVSKENTTLFASDRDMFVFLADEDHKIRVRDDRDGGELSRGFFMWNSETGSQTLGIGMFLFRYACCNRIVWGAEGYREIKIRHTVSAPDRFVEQVRPMLLEMSRSSAQPVIDMVAAAKASKLDDAAEWLAKRYTVRDAASLIAVHQREENRPIENLWDVSTALTARARGMTHQDTRVAAEREAGKVLSMVA
jgi:hypothetical protein